MVLWWIGNALLLLVVVPLVVALANRLIHRALEIKGYAEDILAHGVAVTENLDPVPELAETGRLLGAARDGAARYAAAVARLLRAET